MDEKVKEAFKKCEEFINNSTEEELLEYEKKLNLNINDYLSNLIGIFDKYHGYSGSIQISIEDKIHYGKLLDIKDLVTYEAKTIEELYEQFKIAVDDYLDIKDRQRRRKVLD